MGYINFNEVSNKFLQAVCAQRNKNQPLDEIVLDASCYGWGLCEPLEKQLNVPVRWSIPVTLSLENPTETDYIDRLIAQIERPASTLSSVTLLPAYLPGKGAGYGLQQIFERRLSGSLDPCILLSFQTEKQLKAMDTYGMLVQPYVHVVRLPILKDEFQEVLQDISFKTISGQEIKDAMKVPARQMAQEIIALWRHGKEKDLVNSVFVPLRLALLQDNGDILSQFKIRFFVFYESVDFCRLSDASRFLSASATGNALQDFVKACRNISKYDIEQNTDLQYLAVEQAIKTFQNLSHHV